MAQKSDLVLIVLPGALEHPWGRDDAAWFRARPSRAHRVRRVYPGEFMEAELTADNVWHAVVRKIHSRARLRLPVCFLSKARPVMDELAAHALFDLAMENGEGTMTAIQVRREDLRKARGRMQ